VASLEHVGLAAEDVQAVIDTLDRLLDLRPYKAETVAAQQVRTHFLDAEGAKLELLESLDDASPIRRFLDRRGEGVHHLAFEVEDLAATLDRLRDAGFTTLQDAPQPGADDKRIAFVHPGDAHGVLVEFCETRSPDWTPRRIDHRDGRLALYERGDPGAPSLLLLHGAAGSTRLETAPLMRRLETEFHLLGLDLSGHGASALPDDERLTMDRFVADVRAALDAVEARTAHLFGFSLGSAVALRTAHQHPDRVDRLALCAPNTNWTREQTSLLQDRLTPTTLRDEAPRRAERLAAEHEEDLGALFAALRAFVEPLPSSSARLHDLLSSVTAPTLVAGLDDDPMAPLDAVRDVHRALPAARLAILPGRRHALSAVPVDLLAPLLARHLRPDGAA
jgi:methylmalonyl-CoA epimerase